MPEQGLRVPAPYIEWSKLRPPVANDLSASGIEPLTAAELIGEDDRAVDALKLTGPSDERRGPLVHAVATAFGTAVDRVCCAPAASGANLLTMLSLIRPGDDVLVEGTAYDPLLALPAVLGARVRRFRRDLDDGFDVDSGDIDRTVTDKTRMIVISNPHNPSGAVIDRETLVAIGQSAARVGAVVLVDEVYAAARLAGEPAPVSAALLDGPFVVTNSLSKGWGLPGLRIGWVIAPSPIAARVRRMRDLVDVNGAVPAEHLAVRAFERLEALTERTARILAAQWPLARDALARCPALEYMPPRAGTMVFPRFRDGRSADTFVERLQVEGDTSVVPGRFFDAPSHFRMAFGGSRQPLERALEAIVRFANRP
jgi:aspartate/methionine/tyrosine aminotransferase